MSDRYTIEFSENVPGFIENVATFGTASLIQTGLDAVLPGEHGWICKITDTVTGVHQSRSGATKGEAQEAAFRALKREIEDLDEARERERQRAAEKGQEREEAVRHQQQRQRELPREQPSANQESSEIWGKILGFVIVAVVVIWFVFSVAIPLIVINIAVIALIAGRTKREWNRVLLPLSVLGSVLIVADVSRGWFTKTLVSHVSFFAGLIPIFFYVNIVAGLIAAYFMIRDFLNARTPQQADAGEFTTRNLMTMGCLLLVGGLTVGLQTRFGSPTRQPHGPTARTGDNASSNGAASTSTEFFNGKWKLVAGEHHPVTKQVVKSFLAISGMTDASTAIWTSELDGSVEHKIELKYTRGGLTGDYYGGKGNVVIQALSDGRLSLTINPFGEFAPIKNSIYARVQVAPNKSSVPGRFPFTSTKLLDVADLAGLSKADLKIMRNELFARHGYIFLTPEMHAYFMKQSWYHGEHADVTSMLTAIEQHNVALIKKHE